MVTKFFLFHLAGFLLGSVPIGYLIARSKGIDIRLSGSGNVGATNVGRSLGKSAGIITLVGDVCKGALSVALVGLLPGVAGFSTSFTSELGASVGFCAILGHCYSPFLGWNGGKGVATSLGVFIVLAPIVMLIVVGIFATVALITRYVSLSSIVAAIALPIVYWIRELRGDLAQGSELVFLAAICTALIVVLRHRKNITRLGQGTEPRLTKRNAAAVAKLNLTKHL